MSSPTAPGRRLTADHPQAHPDDALPPGYGTVTPWIISPDTARLIDSTKAAFTAQELACIPGPDGGIGHAEVRIGDSVVMMFDARGGWPHTPAFLRPRHRWCHLDADPPVRRRDRTVEEHRRQGHDRTCRTKRPDGGLRGRDQPRRLGEISRNGMEIARRPHLQRTAIGYIPQSNGAMLYVRGTDNALWGTGVQAARATGWRKIGGKLIDAPAAAGTRDAEPQMIVAVIGTDHAVWTTKGFWSNTFTRAWVPEG